MDHSTTEALSVLEVRDLDGAIEALVAVSRPRYLRSSNVPGLAEAVMAEYPGLIRHRCESGSAHGIEAELRDTELPHLLEHVALERAVAAGAPRALRGETRWDFARDGKGVFRVSLAYRDPESGFDDAAALEVAVRGGAHAVNALVSRCERGSSATGR